MRMTNLELCRFYQETNEIEISKIGQLDHHETA